MCGGLTELVVGAVLLDAGVVDTLSFDAEFAIGTAILEAVRSGAFAANADANAFAVSVGATCDITLALSVFARLALCTLHAQAWIGNTLVCDADTTGSTRGLFAGVFDALTALAELILCTLYVYTRI